MIQCSICSSLVTFTVDQVMQCFHAVVYSVSSLVECISAELPCYVWLSSVMVMGQTGDRKVPGSTRALSTVR